jgi:hypothetical protein
MGPKRIALREPEAAGDAFGDDAERDGCENMADAAVQLALAVVLGAGTKAVGAGFFLGGHGIGRFAWGQRQVGAVSCEGGGQGDEPEEGADGALGAGRVARGCRAVGGWGGEPGVELGCALREAQDDGPD